MRAEDILPDDTHQIEKSGTVIRKGSVAAFLANAKCWSDPTTSPDERATAERDILAALPALRASGCSRCWPFATLPCRDASTPAEPTARGQDRMMAGVSRAPLTRGGRPVHSSPHLDVETVTLGITPDGGATSVNARIIRETIASPSV